VNLSLVVGAGRVPAGADAATPVLPDEFHRRISRLDVHPGQPVSQRPTLGREEGELVAKVLQAGFTLTPSVLRNSFLPLLPARPPSPSLQPTSGMASPNPRPPLGIIGGSSFLDGLELSKAGAEATPRQVTTERGAVTVRDAGEFILLLRHGDDRYYPPHRIPHHAHVLAMEELGVRHVVAFASTGSLLPEIRPGAVVVPDDYMSCHPPPTFCEDEPLHIVPELDAELREFLLEAGSSAASATSVRIRDGGVYAETRGPRFETRAEIRSLARDAHLVGMTAASEATLFQEWGLGYAVLCIVDNWAHGIGTGSLTLEAFRERQAANSELAHRLLGQVMESWHRRHSSKPSDSNPLGSTPP